MDDTIYDHYIAIDWSIKNMAIARMTRKSNKVITIDVPSNIVELQTYLKNLKGTKILVVEETTVTQWLYTELRDYVDKVFICDPYRNRLLSEGPKTDKIDAEKLVHLLKSGLMKEVYHSGDRFLYLRRLVSGYEDLVKSGVRLKNQRYSLLRSSGKQGYEEEGVILPGREGQFVLKGIDRQINLYEEEKKGYQKEFNLLSRKYPEIRHQRSLPGIDIINAVKIVSRVVSPRRFKTNGNYLSYSGLIKLEKISGGKSYGQRKSRYSRQMKSVYKTAALVATKGNNPISAYYEYLIKEKGYPEYKARHKSCRRLAILSLGVFRSGKRYSPYGKAYVKNSQRN